MYKRTSVIYSASLIAVILTVSVFFTSCHKKKGFIGEEYYSAPSNFKLSRFQAAKPLVNFANETQYFEATFSSKVSWRIDLKGLISGAEASLSGSSESINDQNSVWNGIQSGDYFFEKNENVEATLSILGSSQIVRDTFKITGAVAFPNIKTIGDMESSTFTKNGGDETSINQLEFSPLAIQGRGMYTIGGVDKNGDYYIGGAYGPTFPAILTTNPDSVYFNIYVYGYGLPNTQLNIMFEETDIMGKDKFTYPVKATWTGWKLVSFKYSASELDLTDPTFVQNGNKNHNPDKITKVNVGLISSPEKNNEAKVSLDLANFTIGKAFSLN